MVLVHDTLSEYASQKYEVSLKCIARASELGSFQSNLYFS